MGGHALLVAGLALWSAPHLLKRVAPAWRARQGDWVKGVVSLLLILSIVLMSRGYRAADPVILWPRVEWLVHANNLLNLVALWLFAASAAGGWIAARMRHPQLTAVKIWAVAHLLVNGSVAALLLFGGLLAWAVAEVALINRQTAWTPREPGPVWRDGVAFAVAVLLYVAAAYIHVWLGAWPFGGA